MLQQTRTRKAETSLTVNQPPSSESLAHDEARAPVVAHSNDSTILQSLARYERRAETPLACLPQRKHLGGL